MQPRDTEAVEQAHWATFVQSLAAHLAAQWPAMPERLGDRYAAFVDHAVQQGLKCGLSRAAAVARYANLWFVWGPAFQDKPGFEWAQGLLAAPREREWGTVHQLVQRSRAELQRLPDTRIDAETLAAVDQRLIDTFGQLGRHGALHPSEPPPAPRRACDLQAVELRLLQAAVTEQYTVQAGSWQRLALPLPAPLRIDASNPMPRLIAVLSNPPGLGSPAKLQLRSHTHAACDGDVHPALRFAGSHGLWQWSGAETRALSWPVAALAQPFAPGGPGTAIAEETSPEVFKLDLDVCGLRDEGDALGSLSSLVWVWPAAQWWLELKRTAAASQPVAPKAPVQAGSTSCRVECDGRGEDAAPLRRCFEQGLDRLTDEALHKLLQTLSGIESLHAPRLEGSLALLVGRAALSWGWRLGAGGLDGRALMRVVGEIEMQAVVAELQFDAEMGLGAEFGAARARLILRCQGRAGLSQRIQRETAQPPLLAALMPALTRFRLPFSAELTPLATDSGALLLGAGPCTGALVGEAGLRPRTSGGSGFEWFAGLRLEAGTLPLQVLDPVLGRRTRVLTLWPEQPLLDWSLA